MKRFVYFVCVLALLTASSCVIGTGLNSRIGGRIIDHEDATVEGITAARIADAKTDLHIAYWHTSHGSQLIEGIQYFDDQLNAEQMVMDNHYGGNGWYTLGGAGGLDVIEQSPDVGAFAGNVSASVDSFANTVRLFLQQEDYKDTNVVMASWCGQIGNDSTTESDINHYLAVISQLEAEYPGVVFVYMTGHADGGGLAGQVHRYNQIIRNYCIKNGKWLYDFYDIECYNPDGKYFGDKNVNDNCDYDTDGNGSLDGNWALEWQPAHPGQWWECPAAHSQALNGNQKAKAVWQLWCAIAREMR